MIQLWTKALNSYGSAKKLFEFIAHLKRIATDGLDEFCTELYNQLILLMFWEYFQKFILFYFGFSQSISVALIQFFHLIDRCSYDYKACGLLKSDMTMQSHRTHSSSCKSLFYTNKLLWTDIIRALNSFTKISIDCVCGSCFISNYIEYFGYNQAPRLLSKLQIIWFIRPGGIWIFVNFTRFFYPKSMALTRITSIEMEHLPFGFFSRPSASSS